MSNTSNYSKFDPAFIARDTHDEDGHSVRVTDATSIANRYFTHFRVTYNVSDMPTAVNYYRGTTQQRTQFGCVDDVAGNLAGKYFTLNSAPDNKLYYIYYTVGGVGINPNLANATGFAVDVTANDPAIVVAAATNFKIQTSLVGIFTTTRTNAVIDVKAVGFGTVDASTAGTTSFVVQSTLGLQETTNTVAISYSATSNPIYLGQELKGMQFNVFSGKFEKPGAIIADTNGDKLEVNSDGSINVNVVSSGKVLRSYFNEVNNIATGVTTLLATYTATSNVYLQKVELGGTNIAEFELTIAGITRDKKLTSFYSYESAFNFDNGLSILTGQVINVYVVHSRPNIGRFTSRIQILE